jgi:hypothetical protein
MLLLACLQSNLVTATVSEQDVAVEVVDGHGWVVASRVDGRAAVRLAAEGGEVVHRELELTAATPVTLDRPDAEPRLATWEHLAVPFGRALRDTTSRAAATRAPRRSRRPSAPTPGWCPSGPPTCSASCAAPASLT